ncbi:MAG: sugar ABC transporter substrate-binding protein [Acaryochloridaceae cyanobacterium RU_4_10]|nr:sugar ABC transporter substrate-binding protein [Acaryochloridaceae cyanobacterium RU_4_10]
MLKHFHCLSLLAPLLLTLGGCNKPVIKEGTLQLWVHSGQESERQVIEQQVKRFNASHKQTPIEVTFIPEGAYNAQVQAASLSKDLPDILEFDGPFVYNYVWQQNLIPIDNLISKKVQQDLLPSILKQGTYKGRLYSVATFDSGLGLYAHRNQLKAAGVRIPKGNKDAWTLSEFDRALAKLAQKDRDRQVLDLKLNYRGEWFTYGFSPILQSAGGDLIRRSNYQSTDGSLNNPASVAAMKQVQTWIQKGYVDPNIDDAAFASGRVALSWVGHWVYKDYAKALGKNLVVLPLPNFGNGSKTGQGSWNWGITANCKNPKLAMRFLEFLLQPKEVLAMADANGAVPGTKTAIAQSQLYSPSGPLHLFAAQLLAGQTVPRPQTPAYPVITSAFQEAFANIRNGLEVKTALNKAVTTIDLDIQDNQGYPDVSPVARRP